MPEDNREAKVQRLIELMERIGQQMRPDPVEQWPEEELTLPQMRTLGILSRGPARMGDIANHLGSSFPATTSMIDRLVEKGLVKRAHSTVDRRVVTCELSPRGTEVLDSFWNIQRHHARAMTAVMSLDEISTVINALEILQESQTRLNGAPPTS